MKIKTALLQIASHGFDQSKNLLKADTYCRKSAQLGADIALLPEMWNIGYESFDEEVWKQDFNPGKISPEFKMRAVQWQGNAISIDSDFVRHFCKLAKEIEMAIAISFLQKGKSKPYNSAVLIDRDGKIVLNYSKVHTCDFSMEYFCESGNEFQVCDLQTAKGKIRVGVMICFDREFPESARELMLQGAELILIPNCCDMDSHRTAQLKTRAYENMTAIALANYPSPKCNGNSQAYSPVAYDKNGNEADNLILKADQKEGVFIAEFDMDEIREYRKREVWGGKYRKPSAYKLLNTK